MVMCITETYSLVLKEILKSLDSAVMSLSGGYRHKIAVHSLFSL